MLIKVLNKGGTVMAATISGCVITKEGATKMWYKKV